MTGNKKNKSGDSLAALQQVLSDRTAAATRDRTILRDAVCAYLAAERARGTPLGQVTQKVKEVLRKTEKGGVVATDALALQLVNWCVRFHVTPILGRS